MNLIEAARSMRPIKRPYMYGYIYPTDNSGYVFLGYGTITPKTFSVEDVLALDWMVL